MYREEIEESKPFNGVRETRKTRFVKALIEIYKRPKPKKRFNSK